MYRRAYAAPQRGCLCVAPRLRRAMLRLPVPRLRRAEFFVRRAYGGVPQCGCLCEARRAYAVPCWDCLCRAYAALGGAGCTYYAWTSGAMYSLCRSG